MRAALIVTAVAVAAPMFAAAASAAPAVDHYELGGHAWVLTERPNRFAELKFCTKSPNRKWTCRVEDRGFGDLDVAVWRFDSVPPGTRWVLRINGQPAARGTLGSKP